MKSLFFLLVILSTSLQWYIVKGQTSVVPRDEMIRILIFSGRNNHEWQKTTPLLGRIFKDSKLFNVSITERPDTFSYPLLKKFRIVISNWNTWPDNKLRLSAQWERDFMKYVIEGGGVLSFHAGASSFYDWEPYHQIGIGRWGTDTRHGPRAKGHVYGFDQNHPITKGMGDFYIMDEIWENSEIYPEAKAIGKLSATEAKDGHPIDVSAVFVNQTGRGRTFFTTLGHDERALLNSGFQTLLLRAAQWCAGSEVTIPVPACLEVSDNKLNSKAHFNWIRTDTTVTLKNNSGIIWQYNYNNRFGKPYFHPLIVKNSDLSCVSPPDHPWHLGLWFSWKFINGINYWEYMNGYNSPETGYKSEGVTQITEKKVVTNADFSAEIAMKFNYHPIQGIPVLEEERTLHVSAPLPDESYFIDEEHLFKPLADSVLLDRTPISGEPGGQSWGGYSGLSVRFNQDYTLPKIVSPLDSANLRKGNWLYMGFNSIINEKAGISILQHPEFTPGPTRWYVISDQNVPFYYFSPAVLFNRSILLKRGETLRLNYRIWMLPGEISKERLQQKFDQYVSTK